MRLAIAILIIIILVIIYYVYNNDEDFVVVNDSIIPCRKILGGNIIANGYYDPISDQCYLYDNLGAEYVDASPYLELSYGNFWYPLPTYRRWYRHRGPFWHGWGRSFVGRRPWFGASRIGPRPRAPISVPHHHAAIPRPHRHH